MAENVPIWESAGDTFVSGWLSQQWHKWALITNDVTVLSYVHGLSIPFVTTPCQTRKPVCIIRKQDEMQTCKEIALLLKKGTIGPVVHEEGQFISNFFIRPKSQIGKFRLIFNLKKLNECVQYDRFKMENMNTAVTMMTKDCFMANIDLKDAYHNVAIKTGDRKFLKLEWKGQLYQFCALPFGWACAPYVFTSC